MRRFSSYGPIDTATEYYVPRTELIEDTLQKLVGESPERSGHYITVWAPRQSGKSWIMQQIMRRIWNEEAYAQFDVAKVNVQTGVDNEDPLSAARYILSDLGHILKREFPSPQSMEDFERCFTQKFLDKPLILILDEFDSLGHNNISEMIKAFRNIYVKRHDDSRTLSVEKEYLLHGAPCTSHLKT